MDSMNILSTSTKQLEYRRPELKEASLVQHLFEIILDNSFPMFSNQAKLSYKKTWTEEKIKQRIDHQADLLLLAWDQQKPVGLVSGTIPEAGVGTIIWLLIDENYRRRKLGQILLQQACGYYRHLNCHKLKLTAPSDQAKDFYVKQGMSVEGFHPQHWWQADYWALGMIL